MPNRVSPQSLPRWSLQAVLCAALPRCHLGISASEMVMRELGLGLSPQLLHVYHVQQDAARVTTSA